MDSAIPGIRPAPAKPAVAYRIDGLPLVKCPHCDTVNGFPELDQVFVFLCHECGEPVKVTQTIEGERLET
jgi:hypothetical protein